MRPPSRERLYEVRCALCAAPRLSQKKPGKVYTPLVCRACNIERAREALRVIMRRPAR